MMAWLVTAIACTPRPPIGACYKNALSFPVVGRHQVALRIDSEATATLSLRGRITKSGPLAYKIDEAGRVGFRLSPRLTDAFSSFGVRFEGAKYDSVADEASVIIRVPAFALVRAFRLPRLNPHPHARSSAGAPVCGIASAPRTLDCSGPLSTAGRRSAEPLDGRGVGA